MSVPPGPRYIASLVSQCVIPSAVTYLSLRVLCRILGVDFPSSGVVVVSALSKPLLFVIQHHLQPYIDGRAAKQLGAILPPMVEGTFATAGEKVVQCVKTGYPGDTFNVWMEEYGPTYQVPSLGHPMLLTFEPEHIKIMLATQFESFEKGEMVAKQMESLLGSGIFNVDGQMWKFHRSLARPFFSRDRISDFEIFEKNVNKTLNIARRRLDEGVSIDFQDLAARFTLDSATEFLFGADINSLDGNVPYPTYIASKKPSPPSHPSDLFVHSFEKAFLLGKERTSYGPMWPLAEFWGDKIAPLRQILDSFIDPMLDISLQEHAKREQRVKDGELEIASDEEHRTVMDHLVSQIQDRKLIKDEILNLLLAGRDSTSSLLTFALYMLSEHPDAEKRLRAEISEKVGLQEKPTIDQMREMKYTRAFLNEILRLYSPAPFDYRQSAKPVVFPATPRTPAYYIPQGSICVYGVIYMHRRTDLWGPDALKFDPDRFLDERLHKYMIPNPYIFLPFNAGPRICLGQQFAYHKTTYFLIRFLQTFQDFSLDMKENIPPPDSWKSYPGLQATDKVKIMQQMTTFVDGGLWLRMKRLEAETHE